MKAQVSIPAIGATVIGAIILGIAYGTIGLYLSYKGTTIYEDIPDENFGAYIPKKFEMKVSNEATFSFPQVVPHYLGKVELINSNGSICEVSTMEGMSPCNQTRIALGAIPPGQSKSMWFEVEPNKRNFTIRLIAYLTVFDNNFKAKEKQFKCNNIQEHSYLCGEIFIK